MQLNPVHLSVANLLETRLFRIPGYQRAYSWQTRQRQDLFDDIEAAHTSGKEHFMATVVALATDKRSIAAEEFKVVEVVDGQQRLTTLVILLKAIEKALNNADQAEAKSKQSLKDLLVKGDDHSLVLLQTNHDSSKVFLNYIRSGELDKTVVATASDQNLVDAIEECEEFVERWNAENKLIPLLACIRNKLSMIYHELADEATVYRVFEVLNSRGLDVKWIDKTKSQLMASIFEHVDDKGRPDGLKEMQTIWQDIYRVLGLRQSLGDEALQFAGTWICDERPNRIVGQEGASRELIRRAGTKIKSIVESANWLGRIVRLVDRLHDDARRAAVTGIAHARFVAIGIMLRGFDAKTEEYLLSAWERVTFRIYGLGYADSRRKVGEYVRLGYDLVVKEFSAKAIDSRLAALGEGFEIDEILKEEGYWEQSYEGWGEELRYLLYRYEEHLAREAGEQINVSQWNKIWAAEPSKSIEHIMPQSSEEPYIHHLGNLTMLPPGVNSSLKDKAPQDKAQRYLEVGLKETINVGQAISKSGTWTLADVEARAAAIEAFVREEWAG